MGTRKNPRRTKGRLQRLVSSAIAGIMVRANEPKGRKRFAWHGKERGRVITGVNAAANSKQVHDALLIVGLAVDADGVKPWQAPTKKQLRRRRQDSARRAKAADATAPVALPIEAGVDAPDARKPVETAIADRTNGEGHGIGGNERDFLLEPPRV